MLKKFKDLSEKEILAIAIAAEEEDGRIYGEFADALRDEYPSTAEMFEEMRQEEVGHRDRLFAMFRQRFGDHIPLIRRENVKGFLTRKPVWLGRTMGGKVTPEQGGLMERSVSTLAPIFAAAFASHKSWEAFLVGLAASIGAGISMAFSEGLSDDGSLTGRGSPWLRGAVTGLMTTAGGIGHTLPFLIGSFRIAMLVAVIVVADERLADSYIHHRPIDN